MTPAPDTVQFGTAGPVAGGYTRLMFSGNTRTDRDRDPQMPELERMKTDFLVAQQRRRERAAAARRDDTGDGDGPPLAGPIAYASRR